MAGSGDPAFYGDRWAAAYDDHHRQADPGPAVELLDGLAVDGRVRELAIGTGRVALPLAARGITAEGAGAPAAMAGRLRARPAGDSSPVTSGDMAQMPASGRLRLVYPVLSTLSGLLSQARPAAGDSAVIEVPVHDKMRQRAGTQVITLDGQGMHLRPAAIRCSWPAELDLMADQAGLRLAERHAGWDRQPFTSASDGHASVYQRA